MHPIARKRHWVRTFLNKSANAEVVFNLAVRPHSVRRAYIGGVHSAIWYRAQSQRAMHASIPLLLWWEDIQDFFAVHWIL